MEHKTCSISLRMHLKVNIESRFATSTDIMSAFSIFDPRKLPSKNDSDQLRSYGKDSINTLIAHYATAKPAETVGGEECIKEALISDDVKSEWTTYKHFLTDSHEDDMAAQLQELVSNKTMSALCPNLSILGEVFLTIPVSTASVERSFSQMKLIKTRMRSCLSELSLSHLIMVAIEGPNKLTDSDLESIVNVWNRQPRRIAI